MRFPRYKICTILPIIRYFKQYSNINSFKMKLAYDLYCPPGDMEKNLPPVIMLHGMLDSRKTWKSLAPRIANHTGRRVYAVDARNHGDSPWNDDMSFDINADDIDNFLTEHKIPRATIVGHSMGGRTAIGLALKKPDKVEKIVVEDMNLVNFRPSTNSLIVQMINLLRASLDQIPTGVDDITAKRTLTTYMASLMVPGKDPERYMSRYDLDMLPLQREGDKYSWKTNLDVIENMLSTEKIRQTLTGIYMGDALFFYGGKSFFNVKDDPDIPKLFPHATLLGIERATHLLHFEFPGRFVTEVSNFINGTSSGIKAKY